MRCGLNPGPTPRHPISDVASLRPSVYHCGRGVQNAAMSGFGDNAAPIDVIQDSPPGPALQRGTTEFAKDKHQSQLVPDNRASEI